MSGPHTHKPKLLVLGGEGLDPKLYLRSLGHDFDCVVASSDDAIDALERTGSELILMPSRELLPFQREAVARESSVLLNAVGEGLCLAEDDGKVLWANTQYDAYPSQVRQRVARLCVRAAKFYGAMVEHGELLPGVQLSRRARRQTLRFKKLDRAYDTLVSAVLTPKPATDEQATKSAAESRTTQYTVRVAVAVREVTGRERMQSKLKAIHSAGQALMKLDASAVTELHAAERLGLIEERIVKYASELLEYDHFAIRVLDNATNELKVVVSMGLPTEATQIKLAATETGNGISGYVATTGKSYLCDNIQSDPLYVFGMEEAGSSLTVPIKVFDQVIGVFNVESNEPGAFTEQDRQFAEIFGNYIAMALQMLNLLVVERFTTRAQATGTVRGELSAPLNDLAAELESLRGSGATGEALDTAVSRMLSDIQAIRDKVRTVAETPQTILGLDETISEKAIDDVLQGRRILVVDDEQAMRETIRDVLSAQGADVVVCETATGGIKLLDQWRITADAEDSFDLIVSDINTPDGTGYDVFAAARGADEDVPVILMTGFGYDPHHSIVRASQEGLQSVLFKPFRAKKLVAECRKAIRPDLADELEDTKTA